MSLGCAGGLSSGQDLQLPRAPRSGTKGGAGSSTATPEVTAVWRFADSAYDPLPDATAFLATLRREQEFFNPLAPVTVARAPYSLDLMGGSVDYTGALALQYPLSAGVYVAIQPTPERTVAVRATPPMSLTGQPTVALPAESLLPEAGPLSYDEARRLLVNDGQRAWAAHVAGALPVLRREYEIRPDGGLRILVYSEIALGMRLGAAAAMESAAIAAIATLHHLKLSAHEIALLAQMVANLVVGRTCTARDHLAATSGQQDHVLALRSRPAEIRHMLSPPANVAVFGIDAGADVSPGPAPFDTARAAAAMGYRIIADCAGLACRTAEDGTVEIEDHRWAGSLANIEPSTWESEFGARMPESMPGSAFLGRYAGITDMAVPVEPYKVYPIRSATAHAIYEHHRTRLFHAILRASEPGDEELRLLGELMHQSHESCRRCAGPVDAADRLVKLARDIGSEAGLHGARMIDGGGGIVLLAERHRFSVVQRLAAEYREITGHAATILGGSSPGIMAAGVQLLAAT